MTYTVEIKDDTTVVAYKDGKEYEIFPNWADRESAEFFASTLPQRLEEADVKRASGEMAVEEFKTKVLKLLADEAVPEHILFKVNALK